MGRWVCLRCYESNDAALVSCTKCGLARGATPEPPDAAVPAPVPPAEIKTKRAWLRGFAGRSAVAAVVGVVVLAGGLWFSVGRDEGGQITRSGSLAITDLRVGDCFNVRDHDAQEVDEVDGKLCDEPHEYELIFIGDLPDGDFPTDQATTDYFLASCMPAFEAYVGVSFSESKLDLFPFTPTSDGWASGDHTMQCVLFDPADNELTSSLRGVAR
jgi:putative regulator of septum formation